MADKLLAASLLITAVDQASPVLEKVGVQSDALHKRLNALRDPLGTLGDATERMADRMAGAAAPLADVGRKVLTLTGAMSGIGAIMGGLAYEAAKKFESAQLSLKKVMDESDGPVEQYTEAVQGLALTYGENANVLTESAATFKQAGFTAAEAVALVKNNLDLMVAGEIEAARASELITSALKGFNAPASDAARLVDILNEVSQKYATNVEELAEGMADLSPIASQMGLSFEETAGILTPVIEVFRSGSEAADGLKTGLLKLVDDTTSVRSALASIGVAQTELNGSLRPAKDILADVSRAFQSMGENQKLYVTQQLVGIEQSARMVKVFDNLAKVSEITATAMNAAGSAAKEVEIRLKSAEAVGNRTAEAFRQAATAIGTQYRDAVTGVVDATGDLAQAFTKAVEAGSLEGLFAAVRPQLQAVERLFRETAAALPAAFAKVDFTRVGAAIADFTGVAAENFRALFGAIDITTADGLAKALQMIADGIAAVIEFSAGFTEELKPLFAALGKMAQMVVNNTDGFARFAGEMTGMAEVVRTVGPIIGDLSNALLSTIGTVAELTFKVGLLVLGWKALNAVGISVLPTLGALAAGIGGLSVRTGLLAATLAGVPGLLLGVVAAAGGAGYAIGTVLNSGLDAVIGKLTGGNSLGGLIYDAEQAIRGLIGASTDAEKAERALAEAQQKAADAARKRAEEARKAAEEEEKAAAARRRANQDVIDAAEQQARTNDLLRESFAAMGLAYDATTGRLVPLSGAMRGQVEASAELQSILKALGIEYDVLTNKITADGQVIIDRFRAVTTDLTTNAEIVRTALAAAVDSAKTRAELDALEGLYRKWAASAGQSADEVEQALEGVRKKSVDLRGETDALEKALSDAGLKGPKVLAENLATATTALVAAEQAFKQGKVGADLVKEAFLNQVEAAVALAEATGKPIDPALSLKAAALGLTEELEKLTGASNRAAQAAGAQSKAQQDAARVARDAATDAAESARETADAQDNANDRMAQATSLMGAVRQKYAELGEGAAAYFDTLRDGLKHQHNWMQAIDRAWEILSDAQFERIKRQYGEQEQALADLVRRIQDGTASTVEMEQATHSATSEFSLLGEERLQPLRDALADAKRRVEELRESARDTMADIQDELDRLEGREADILRREYDERRKELEAKLKDAQVLQDREAIESLRESIRLLDELYEKKIRNAEAGTDTQEKASQDYHTKEIARIEERKRAEIGAAASLKTFRDDLAEKEQKKAVSLIDERFRRQTDAIKGLTDFQKQLDDRLHAHRLKLIEAEF